MAALAASGLLPASQAAGAPAASAQTPGADWPGYLFGAGHDSFNPGATAITPANAASVVPVWMHKTGKRTGTTEPARVIQASPTVVGGRVYVGAETGVFSALDGSTGAVVWQEFLGFVPQLTCSALGITSTATVAADPVTGNPTVYVSGGDGYLYALNAADGTSLWRAVIDLPSTTVNDYYDWSSPVVSGGHIYLGVSSFCDNPLVHGGVKEYDQATGALQATWNTMPASGGLGGSVWSSPAAASDGSIIVTTGNGGKPKGGPPDTDSIVRLDGTNLSRLDGWQVPLSQQINDGDFGASPTLFTATLAGVPTPMVGACNKNGFYYALRVGNLSAGPVWSFKMGDADGIDPSPGFCDAAAIWDGSKVIEGGNGTTIAGVAFPGSARAFDPATGAVLWQTGLPGQVIGSPTEDGSGVVALPMYKGSQPGVALLNAATGSLLTVLSSHNTPVFAQPVFADDGLFLAGGPPVGVTKEHVPVAPGA